MENWDFSVLETFLLMHKKFKDAFDNISEDTILALMDPHEQFLPQTTNVVVPSNCLHCGLTPEDAKARKEEKQYQYEHICESITERMRKYGITHLPTVKAAVFLMQQETAAGCFTVPYIKQTLQAPHQESQQDSVVNSLDEDLPSYHRSHGNQTVQDYSQGSIHTSELDLFAFDSLPSLSRENSLNTENSEDSLVPLSPRQE